MALTPGGLVLPRFGADGHRRRGALDDAIIRASLQKHLTISEAESVVHELPIALGFVRLDVAILGQLVEGYEIKSDLDRLDRLERQLAWYLRVCDRLTIVTTAKHVRNVRRMIPDCCGILVAADDAQGGVCLSSEREATANPQWDVCALLLLLWQSEIQRLASNYGVKTTRSLPKGLTNELLSRRIDHDVLRAEAIATLRRRTKSSYSSQ